MILNEQIKKCNELKRKYLIEVLMMPHFYGTNKSRLFYFNGDCQVGYSEVLMYADELANMVKVFLK